MTLLDDFYNRYENTWFIAYGSKEDKSYYYHIVKRLNYNVKFIHYYEGTDRFYEDFVSFKTDHLCKLSIIKDKKLVEKMDTKLAKELLSR